MAPEDVPEVSAIERLVFSQPWSEKGFWDALGNPAAVFFVAEEEAGNSGQAPAAVIAGYIGMYAAAGEGEITNVAVGQPFRRTGVGKALLGALLSYAKEQGITRIVLEVRVSNAPAAGLYETYGFVRVGTRKDFYQFPREDAGIMVWEC